MSMSVDHKRLYLAGIRKQLAEIKRLRAEKNFSEADEIRKQLLSLDDGMQVGYHPTGRVTLWHWPKPPATLQFYYLNYGEFIANSEEHAS